MTTPTTTPANLEERTWTVVRDWMAHVGYTPEKIASYGPGRYREGTRDILLPDMGAVAELVTFTLGHPAASGGALEVPFSARWRACLGPLEKPMDDGRILAGEDWTLREGQPVALFGDDEPQPPDDPYRGMRLTGIVDRVAVEGGRIIAYGEVTDRETAEGMFSGQLRPEAGWLVADGAMDSEPWDDGVRTIMSGGRLGYVKASSGPSPWPDSGDTWFESGDTTGPFPDEDTTGGAS